LKIAEVQTSEEDAKPVPLCFVNNTVSVAFLKMAFIATFVNYVISIWDKNISTVTAMTFCCKTFLIFITIAVLLKVTGR
jgi:hypothetical protein